MVCVQQAQAAAPPSSDSDTSEMHNLSAAAIAEANLGCIGCIPPRETLAPRVAEPLHVLRLSDNCEGCHEEGFVISITLASDAQTARAQLTPVANALEARLVSHGVQYQVQRQDTRYQQALAAFQTMRHTLNSESPWAAQDMIVKISAVLAILEAEAEASFITAPGSNAPVTNVALVSRGSASTLLGALQQLTIFHALLTVIWWAGVVFVFVVALSVLYAVSRRGPPVPVLFFDIVYSRRLSPMAQSSFLLSVPSANHWVKHTFTHITVR